MVHEIEEKQLGQLAKHYPSIIRNILSCSPSFENKSQLKNGHIQVEKMLENLLVLKDSYHQLQAEMKASFGHDPKSDLCEVENGLMLEKIRSIQQEIQDLEDKSRKEEKIMSNIVASSKTEAIKILQSVNPEEVIRLKFDIIDHFVEEEWIESFKFYLRNCQDELLGVDARESGVHQESHLDMSKSSLYEFSYMADQVDNHFVLDKLMICFEIPSRKPFFSPPFNLEKHFRPFRSSFKLQDFQQKLDLFRIQHAPIKLIWPNKYNNYVLGEARLPLDDLIAIYLLFLRHMLSSQLQSKCIFEPDLMQIEKIKFMLNAEFLLNKKTYTNPYNFSCDSQMKKGVLELINAVKASYKEPGQKLSLLHFIKILEKIDQLFKKINGTSKSEDILSGFENFNLIKQKWNKISQFPFAFKYSVSLKKSEFLQNAISKNENFIYFHKNKENDLIGFMDLVIHLNSFVHVQMFEHLCELLYKKESAQDESQMTNFILEVLIEDTEFTRESQNAHFDLVVFRKESSFQAEAASDSTEQSYIKRPIMFEDLYLDESKSNSLKLDLSGNCYDELSFEIYLNGSRSESLFRFDLASSSQFFRSPYNMDDQLRSSIYKFNYCSAFQFQGKKYALAFRYIAKKDEVSYEFDVLKVFKSLRSEQWYYNTLDKLKEKFGTDKNKILYFIRESLKIKEGAFTLSDFMQLSQYLHLFKEGSIQGGAPVCDKDIFLDDIENYIFENVEDLKVKEMSFKDKGDEFKRKSYIKQRANIHGVFDNYFELKLFFGWVTSYKLQIQEKELYFLLFEEYLDLVKHFQEYPHLTGLIQRENDKLNLKEKFLQDSAKDSLHKENHLFEMFTRNLSSLPPVPSPPNKEAHALSVSHFKKNPSNLKSSKLDNKVSNKSIGLSKFGEVRPNHSVHFDLSKSHASLQKSIEINFHEVSEHPTETDQSRRNPSSHKEQARKVTERADQDSKHKCVFKTVESFSKDETLESISAFSDAQDELLLETLHTLKKFCIENDCSFQELFRMFDTNQKGYLKFEDFNDKVRSLGIETDPKVIKFCFIYLDRNSTGKLYEPVFAQILSQF